MHSLADNTRGSVLILDGWNEKTHTFTRITQYLDHLRNPNNIAFWTDPATQQSWLYLPLSDGLVRYKYKAGDNAPASPPETLIKFPDYGLNYKYGGWHLTRTVAIAKVGDATRIVVSVGSSCNYCQEDEVLRASVVSMDPDGKNPLLIARGLRNAVDIHAVRRLMGRSLPLTWVTIISAKSFRRIHSSSSNRRETCAELWLAYLLFLEWQGGSRQDAAANVKRGALFCADGASTGRTF